MEKAKCPYFITSLLFGIVGVFYGLALIPFTLLLSTHVYVMYIKPILMDKSNTSNIIARLEQLERYTAFKR
jgi:NhaP-type Na+/H+ or K+/H+ antiporter